MNQQRQYNNTPRKLTATDEMKLRLQADPVGGGKRKPTLSVQVVKNNVRLMVYTNVEGDRDGGKVSANMDSPVFFMFLHILKQVLAHDGPVKRTIANKNFTWDNGQRSDDTKVVSKTIIAKEEDGSVFISVVNQSVTPVKFYFIPSDFHILENPDGTPASRAEVTVAYGNAWCDLFSALTPAVLANNFEPPEPKNNNGGNNWNKRPGPDMSKASSNDDAFGTDLEWSASDDLRF